MRCDHALVCSFAYWPAEAGIGSSRCERDGLVARRVYAEVPPRVEYTLTELGRTGWRFIYADLSVRVVRGDRSAIRARAAARQDVCMTPEEIVRAAIEAAESGLKVGELPIGAVVLSGDEVIGWAYTSERGRGRRLVHAGLLAMMEADERLGWADHSEPLRLGVSLEPCVMCLGAAMALGVREVYFAVESPGDGAGGVAATWRSGPGLQGHRAPAVHGGIHRAESREQFRRYTAAAADSPLRDWARTIADLPD